MTTNYNHYALKEVNSGNCSTHLWNEIQNVSQVLVEGRLVGVVFKVDKIQTLKCPDAGVFEVGDFDEVKRSDSFARGRISERRWIVDGGQVLSKQRRHSIGDLFDVCIQLVDGEAMKWQK